MRHLLLTSFVLFAFSCALAVDIPSQKAGSNGVPLPNAQFVPMSPGMNMQTLKMCADTVPSGWIIVNLSWNPTVCGSPNAMTLNEWTLERFETKFIGTTIDACVGTVPSGWVVVDTYRDSRRCGNPGQPQNNMMRIQRVN